MTCAGLDITTATLCASLLIGLGSLWLGGRIYCPTTVLSIPALLPMVPGIYAYKDGLRPDHAHAAHRRRAMRRGSIWMRSCSTRRSPSASSSCWPSVRRCRSYSSAAAPSRSRGAANPVKPDCMEIFWNTIARYNAATWPWQIAIVAAAAVLTVLLYLPPDAECQTGHETFLAGLNALDRRGLLSGLVRPAQPQRRAGPLLGDHGRDLALRPLCRFHALRAHEPPQRLRPCCSTSCRWPIRSFRWRGGCRSR